MAAPPPSRSRPATDAEITPDERTQLESCRSGILDSKGGSDDRKRWVELLFTLDPKIAADLVVQLLSMSDQADVQLALCDVIASRARTTPARLRPSYVEPLVALLGRGRADLRSAAGRALADFPGVDTPTRLGALASDASAPMITRLSAIDTLALRVDRRDVVNELIGLLDADVEEITERIVAALEPTSRTSFGTSIEKWRAWWSIKSAMSEEDWLTDRLQMYRQRLRTVEGDARSFRDAANRHNSAVSIRLGELQREVYRGLSTNGRQPAKLAEWLTDPLTEVQATALAIIRAQISDEGRRPSDEVVAALLSGLKNGSMEIQLDVLLILQTLKGSLVEDAVLKQLERERNVVTRQALLRALGKLATAKAVPALVQEIAATASNTGCVREAATSLGQLAEQSDGGAGFQAAVGALKKRYQLTDEGETALRGALLQAMASVADQSFLPVFSDAIESDFTEIIRPAIRGLAALGDTAGLPRMRALLTSPDALVRLEAIDAVGKLGRDEADLEGLLLRINPNNESERQLRESAWRGVRAYAAQVPLERRIQMARRLRDVPDLEVRYLQELKDELTGVKGGDASLALIRDRLATVYAQQGKFADAAVQLGELFESYTKQDPSKAVNGSAATGEAVPDEVAIVGLRWLEASLRVPDIVNVADVILRLAAHPDGSAVEEKITSTVAGYLAECASDTGEESARTLLTRLRDVPADLLGAGWGDMLDHAEMQLSSAAPAPVGKSSPSG